MMYQYFYNYRGDTGTFSPVNKLTTIKLDKVPNFKDLDKPFTVNVPSRVMGDEFNFFYHSKQLLTLDDLIDMILEKAQEDGITELTKDFIKQADLEVRP